MPRKPKTIDKPKEEKQKYTCMSCCVEKDEDKFFQSKWSKMWQYSNKKVLFCKDCINQHFDEMKKRYESESTALKACCYLLDVPFYMEMYQSIIESNSIFSVGLYLRHMNLGQMQFKTYLNTITENQEYITIKEAKESRETKWSKTDLQSKDRVIKIIKYDPFEDYDDFSRKLMFNLTSDYLINEEVINDPHKLQGVIEMVRLYQQADILNKQILEEFNSGSVNEGRIKTLSTIKKDCLASINSFAKDNGFSASLNSKGNKGSSSLAYFVKVLDELKFTESKVNLFDLKTCESFRQFADISNSSILQQIRLNQDDIGDMIATQRTTLIQYKEKLDKTEEQNRLLKITLKENNIPYEEEIEEDILDIDNFNLEDDNNELLHETL